MSGQATDRLRDQTESPTPPRSKFEEVPGEAEAAAAQSAYLASAASPGLAPRLGGDARVQEILRMQAVQGNQVVQRAIAQAIEHQKGGLVGESQSDMVAEVRRRSDAGTELPADARERLEAHSGVDLSQVRVHTDGPAESLTRELSADAFTVGTDIFVAPRAYAPDTVSGQALLAHEVTHVAQQTGGEVVQRATATVEAPDNTAEAGDKREELAKQQAEQAQQAQQGGSAADGAAGAGGPAPAGTPPVGGVGGEIASAPPGALDGSAAASAGGGTVSGVPVGDAGQQAAAAAADLASVPGEGVQLGSAFEAGPPVPPPPAVPAAPDAVPAAPEVPPAPAASEGAAAAIGIAMGGAAAAAVEVGADVALGDVGSAAASLAVTQSVGANLGGAGVGFALAEAEKSTDPLQADTAQAQRAQAESLAAAFVANNTGRVDEMIAVAATLPDQLSVAAERAKAAIAAAVEQHCGELSATIAMQQASAAASAAAARAAILAQHAATVPAIQATTQSARARIQAAHIVSLAQLDARVAAQNAKIEGLYTSADPKFRAAGPKVGDEAVAVAAAAAAEYLTHKINREDGFWDGHLTDNKCEARADAANNVGKSYKDELIKAANEQADKAREGKATDLNHVTEAATQCRQILTTQLNGAMDGLTQFESSALASAEEAKTNLLQTVDANLAATLNVLASQEALQVQALAEQGERQKAGVDRDAAQASAALMDGTTQAAAAVHGALNEFAATAAATQAPDPNLLFGYLTEAQANIDVLLAQFGDEFQTQRLESEQRFSEAAAQSADIFSSLSQSGVQQATEAGDQFSIGMADLTQNATDAFAQLQQTYSTTTDKAVSSATDGFNQVNQGVQQLFDSVATNLEAGFTQAEKGLDDGLRAGLNKEPGLRKAIADNAEQAADAVKPWWKSVLKWVLIIAVVLVVAIVVGPAVIGFVGGLAAGALGVAATSLTATIIGGVVGGAIVGAASSAVIQIGSNLIDGVNSFGDAFKGVGRAMAIGAIGGAIGGLGGGLSQLVGRGVEAGALSFAQTAGRFGIGQVFGVGGGALGEFLVTGQVNVTGVLVGAAVGLAASGVVHGFPKIGAFSQRIATSSGNVGVGVGESVRVGITGGGGVNVGGVGGGGTGTGTTNETGTETTTTTKSGTGTGSGTTTTTETGTGPGGTTEPGTGGTSKPGTGTGGTTEPGTGGTTEPGTSKGQQPAGGGTSEGTLKPGPPADMLREAVNNANNASPSQRAALIEDAVQQIKQANPGAGWDASRGTGSDGSTVFIGTQGRTIVIDPQGNMFVGDVGNPTQFGFGKGGTIVPNYENLRPLSGGPAGGGGGRGPTGGGGTGPTGGGSGEGPIGGSGSPAPPTGAGPKEGGPTSPSSTTEPPARGPESGPTDNASPTGGGTGGAASAETANPNSLKFSQKDVGGKIGDGSMTLEQLTESMRTGGWKGDPINVVEAPDGSLVSLDNRRLVAAQNAGLKEIPILRHSPEEPIPPAWAEEGFVLEKPIRQLPDGQLVVGGTNGEIVYPKGYVATTYGEAALIRTANQGNLPLPSGAPPGTAGERFPLWGRNEQPRVRAPKTE